VIAVVGGIMLYQLTHRTHMGLSVLHVRAPMYTLAKVDMVRNGYTLRFSNKAGVAQKFALEVGGLKGASIKSEEADAADGGLTLSVDPDATQEIQLYVTAPRASLSGSSETLTMKATDLATGESSTVSDHFFGP
jgi:polyferredoxin